MAEFISVDCVGDIDFDYSDDDIDIDYSDDEEKQNDNNPHTSQEDKRKHYKFNKLPGQTAFFIIKKGNMNIELQYNLWGLKENKLRKFVDSMRNKNACELSFRPGSNQEAQIKTDASGNVSFYFYGAGGDNPTCFDITIPSQYCIEAFERLLP